MGKERRKIFVSVSILILVAISIWGFCFIKENDPIRVSFFTKGGGVIFDHKFHATLENQKCEDCHHNYDSAKKNLSDMNCRQCHYGKNPQSVCSDAPIHQRCIGKNCIDCHVNGSASCEFCHNAESFQKVVAPKMIRFETAGGPVNFNHFTHASPEEYDLACDECHHGYDAQKKQLFMMNCRQCHYNTVHTSLCEDDDMHVRCIGKNCINCHSDGVDDCEICHKE